MEQENEQPDIPQRPGRTTAGATVWTDIGEAEITHTIFGKAKVRIIRKRDKTRRVLLIASLLMAAVVAWQAGLATRQVQDMAAPGAEPQAAEATAEEPAPPLTPSLPAGASPAISAPAVAHRVAAQAAASAVPVAAPLRAAAVPSAPPLPRAHAPLPAVPHAASQPVAAGPVISVLPRAAVMKENAPASAPTGDNSPSVPSSVQGK